MPSESELEAGRDEIARRLQQIHKLHLSQRSARQPQMRNMEGEGDTLTSLAFSIMGMNGTVQTSNQIAGQQAQATGLPSTRPPKRAQSYFNSFQTTCTPTQDDPPTYAAATRQRPVSRRDTHAGREALPSYSCSVSAGATMLVNMESVSPLHNVQQSEWRDVFVEVRGTLLNFHRVKDGRPYRLLRSYTLQHAEVGLAPDAYHTVLAPNSRLAHLIPSSARQKAFRKDPQLFRAEEQFILRLRVETDQILLAHKCEDKILEMLHAIGAGIDLAPAIDERSISKQCTVPRRRRRPATQAVTDINSAAVIAEQERILQQMYPSLARETNEHSETMTQTHSSASGTPSREDDEIDISAIREDFSDLAPTSTNSSSLSPTQSNISRPAYSRTTTASSTSSDHQQQMVYQTAPTNFNSQGKWAPPHLRTSAQIRRYVRRCAPLLTLDAVRASDIVICNGKRMRINWREERLEHWRLQPPTYAAHDFLTKEQQEQRQQELAAAAIQVSSANDNTNTTATPEDHNRNSNNAPSSLFSETSSSSHDDIDAITPLEEAGNAFGNLDLVKTSTGGSIMSSKKTSITTTTTTTTTTTELLLSTTTPASRQKAREVQRENNGGAVEAQAVVFCF
jgi:hypothetical protein